MAIHQQSAQYQLPILAHPTKSGGTVNTVNLRDLHRELGVGRDFSNWVKGRIATYGFEEGKDFVIVEDLRSPNLASAKARPQKVVEYHATIDMAKELAMVENNDRGREIRRYFIEAEKRLREAKMAPVMPYHLRRYVDNIGNVPAGYFSILTEMAVALVGPMEALGYTMPARLWADISQGKLFCKWLRDEKGVDTDALPTYPQALEDGRVVRPKAYPLTLVGDFRLYLQNVWIPRHAAEYFAKRDPAALAYLPHLLAAPLKKAS